MDSNGPDPRFEPFAAREPYFAVLTSPKFLRANLTAEHEREFFEGGEDLVQWMFTVIEGRLQPRFAPMTTLEYGCGIGRLALPLARRPGAVVAVDRSPAMLAQARDLARARGCAHIDFLAAAEFHARTQLFDLVCCFNVLQRMPPKDGLSLLLQLIGRLATGGVGVFHVPFRNNASAAVRASRVVRQKVPLANTLANTLRGKMADEPLIPTHVYDLDKVFRLFEAAGIAATHVVFEQQQELASAIIFAERPLPSITGVDEKGRPLPGTSLRLAPPAEPVIDVVRLIATTSIDELNRTAEQYFSSLTDWDDHLAKPFSKPIDTPPILSNLAALLHGLNLRPGATVLEFGAGTGWLSRFLTQLGCRAILLDVSASALQIAREQYRRVPVIGDRPAPVFLQFDGRRIDLPDASVDRILSFDAFHHVPNAEAVIAEFARVLRPGGIAGFSEPGARHSETPMSQFEMRTYGVVENNIDIHAIWRQAERAGFRDLRLALFHGPPFYVSLPEYGDFLAGGQTVERWLTSTRVYLRHVRNFFLIREGEEPADSRTVQGLSAAIDARPLSPARAGEAIELALTVTNVGTAIWLPEGEEYGGVRAGAHLYDAAGALVSFEIYASPLTDPPRSIAPGETVQATLTVPPQPAGHYRLEIDCVADKVTWFAQVGSKTRTLTLEI
jgi:SAM-dependent methyltransferase